MRRIRRRRLPAIVAVVLGIGVLAVGAWVFWVWRYPLAAFEAKTRRDLARAGFERRELELPGGRLVYWQGGEGPDLVLLHGAGDQAGNWAKVAPALAAGHRVLIPDLPGHGESDPESGPIAMAAVVAGAEGFLAGRGGAGPAIVVGNSMGGWIGALLAHRHPEAVARLVLVNGGPVRGEPSGLTLTPADREEARRLMAGLRDPTSPPVPDFVLDAIVRRSREGPIGRLMQDLAGMEAHLLDGRLGEIAVPVDLVWGESDRHLPLAYAWRLEAELPRARLTVVPRCGHLPHNECPERLLEALEEVLAAPPPAAREAAAAEGATEPAAEAATESAAEPGEETER